MNDITIEKIRFTLDGSKRLVRVYDIDIGPLQNERYEGVCARSHEVWFGTEKEKFKFKALSFSFYGNAELKFIDNRPHIISKIIMMEGDFVDKCRKKEVDSKPIVANIYCFTKKEYDDLIAEEVIDSL